MRKTFLIAAGVFFAGAAMLLPSFRAGADGFGITPPYVKNESLTQNSHYEQQIILVRSDPTQDLKATVSINVPGANDWITVDRGMEFTLPAGTQQEPIIVSVNVPGNAKLGRYLGNIQVVVSPLGQPTAGTVGITIGAQINVDLQVINQKSVAFTLHRVAMTNTEEGHAFWWMHFPGKVTFTMDIENTGNIAGSPRKVTFEYRDYLTQALLDTEQNTNGLSSIQPFETKQVVAEMPVYLPRGSYRVFYTVYGRDDNDIIGQGMLDLGVLPPGTLSGYSGYGFWGIRTQEKAITFGLIILVLGLAYLIYVGIKRFLRKKRHGKRGVAHLPPRPPEGY
jgi:hypothetical protein